MRFKIAVGETLKVKHGFSALILMTDACGEYPIVGVVRHKTGDEPASWTRDGKFSKNKDTQMDLVLE